MNCTNQKTNCTKTLRLTRWRGPPPDLCSPAASNGCNAGCSSGFLHLPQLPDICVNPHPLVLGSRVSNVQQFDVGSLAEEVPGHKFPPTRATYQAEPCYGASQISITRKGRSRSPAPGERSRRRLPEEAAPALPCSAGTPAFPGSAPPRASPALCCECGEPEVRKC